MLEHLSVRKILNVVGLNTFFGILLGLIRPISLTRMELPYA